MSSSRETLARTAFHEAGHALTAYLMGWTVAAITIKGNEARGYGGKTVYLLPPAVDLPPECLPHQLPAQTRHLVDLELITAAAGHVAADLATAGNRGRRPDTLAGRLDSVRRHAAVTGPPRSQEASRELALMIDPAATSGPPTGSEGGGAPRDADDETLMWHLALAVSGGDLAMTSAHLDWAVHASAALLRRHPAALEFVAAQLMHCRSLDQTQATLILDTALALSAPAPEAEASA